MSAPKIFISYSWKPQVNKNKVIQLAERLSLDGVHVILDIWDLAEGQDKYVFMEQMVNNEEIKRVLIICNKDYKEKANEKRGGVGAESLVISDEIYKQADQNKFVPIIFERDIDGSEFTPTFVKSRIYIDLSNDIIFEDEYEKLLRNIFDKPAYSRPPIGKPPVYLEQEKPSLLRTAHKVGAIKDALVNEKRIANALIDDYYESFVEALLEYRIKNEEITPNVPIDDIIVKMIEELKPLRNDFVEFQTVLIKYSINYDIDKLFEFWQKMIEVLINASSNEDSLYSNSSMHSDHIRFFINELFMYQIRLLYDRDKFEEISHLLFTPYVVLSRRYQDVKTVSFCEIRSHIDSLQRRNERLQLRRMSLKADLIKERTSDSAIKFEELLEIDCVLHYAAILNRDLIEKYNYFIWFPELSIYHRSLAFVKIKRFVSKKFFEKAKSLFNVESREELILKMQNIRYKENFSNWDFDFPAFTKVLDPNIIATSP